MYQAAVDDEERGSVEKIGVSLDLVSSSFPNEKNDVLYSGHDIHGAGIGIIASPTDHNVS